MNHRELAEEEASAWMLLYPEQRRPYTDGIGSYWKAQTPPRPDHQVTLRHRIWRAHNEALWAEVERGMPLGTAVRLIAEARASKASLEDCIAQYKSGNTLTQTSDGRVFRKNYASKAGSEPPPPPEPPQEFAREWSSIRELIEYLARRELSGEDPVQTEPLITNFLIDVKAGVESMRRALQRRGEFTVSRRKVIDACRFLNVGIPPPGTPANEEIFRKNAKQLRYENHQDRLGSAYDHEYYLNIGRALDYLDQYNKAIGGASCPQTTT